MRMSNAGINQLRQFFVQIRNFLAWVYHLHRGCSIFGAACLIGDGSHKLAALYLGWWGVSLFVPLDLVGNDFVPTDFVSNKGKLYLSGSQNWKVVMTFPLIHQLLCLVV